MEDDYKKYREMNRSAVVLGYTGESGKALVQALVDSQIFQKVVLLGRRNVMYPEDEKYNCLEQRVIDFDNLEAYKADFTGFDVGYCCLGTTRGKSGKEGFKKVDHDYIVNTARLAKDSGCKEFHLVSSQGANANSWLLYTQVKGQVENELKEFGFERYYVYRPAVLMCDREEKRTGEGFIRALLKPVAAISPTMATTPTTTLAKAMVNCTVKPSEESFKLFNNKDIFRQAGEL